MPKKIYKVISLLLCFLLIFEQSGFAQMAGQLDISGYLAGLRNALAQDKFRPLHLRYLSYDTLNNNFRLLLDKGDLKDIKAPQVQETTQKLLEYFFVGVSLPNSSFWVNLRPDSPDNIIDPYLAKTDVGKILLEADLQLKKDTAKFTSPENPKGREYWEKLYRMAGELFGYDNITIPTLTRPWIVPDEIIVREANDNAYIYKATLKVQLEQDHLQGSAVYNFDDPRLKELNEYSSQLIRELIIPELTKEINISKRYASLRQVYYSLILSQWFKQKFSSKGGFYSSIIDRRNLNGITSKDDWSKTAYFKEYQKSFQKGEYNIQQPVYTPFGQTIRSYFSGGIDFGVAQEQGGVLATAIQRDLVQASTPGDVLAGNSHTLPPVEVKGGNQDNVGVDRDAIKVNAQPKEVVITVDGLSDTNNFMYEGTMGRWKYTHSTFDPGSGTLTLHNATRIPRKDNVVEEEFLIDGQNKPRDIVLRTRKLTSTEQQKISAIRQELDIDTEFRVILRDQSVINNRIYGIAAQGIPFIREDIIAEGNRDQIKEALDHENRELTAQDHDIIRREQYQGNLRSLITQLSEKDKTIDDRIGYPLLGGYLPEDIRVIVIGTGGFIRTEFAAMIDRLNKEGKYNGKMVIVEPRSTKTAEYIKEQGGSYDVVTKYPDGRPNETYTVTSIAGVGSLTNDPTSLSLRGDETGRAAFLRYAGLDIDLIGIGVTEAGIQPNSQAMKDLVEFLYNYFKHHGSAKKISIINTDNVPGNGDIIKKIITELAKQTWSSETEFANWLETGVTFHNTMVDRIVDSPKEPSVPPFAEPVPAVRMTIEDLKGTLTAPLNEIPGVKIRTKPGEMDMDHAWKLRILNAGHTSQVYIAALSGLPFVRNSIGNPYIEKYVETLEFENIAPVMDRDLPVEGRKARDFAAESIERFKNPNIDQRVRWVAQDAIYKFIVRLLETVKAKNGDVTPEMAFSLASILRYETPISGGTEKDASGKIIYKGKNDPNTNQEETYEFQEREKFRQIPDALMNIFGKPRDEVSRKLHLILGSAELWNGVNLAQYQNFANNVIDMYYRMVSGESTMQVLKTISILNGQQGPVFQTERWYLREELFIPEGEIAEPYPWERSGHNFFSKTSLREPLSDNNSSTSNLREYRGRENEMLVSLIEPSRPREGDDQLRLRPLEMPLFDKARYPDAELYERMIKSVLFPIAPDTLRAFNISYQTKPWLPGMCVQCLHNFLRKFSEREDVEFMAELRTKQDSYSCLLIKFVGNPKFYIFDRAVAQFKDIPEEFLLGWYAPVYNGTNANECPDFDHYKEIYEAYRPENFVLNANTIYVRMNRKQSSSPVELTEPSEEDHAAEGDVSREDVERILADASGRMQSLPLPREIIQVLEQIFGPGRLGTSEITVIPQELMVRSDGRSIYRPIRLNNQIFAGDRYFADHNRDFWGILHDIGHEEMARWIAELRPDLNTDADNLARQVADIIRVAQQHSLTAEVPAVPHTTSDKGGIDLRALPIVTQPPNTPRINVPLSRLDNIDLDSEWAQIQNMLNAGIIPSSQRIKEYLQACCQSESLNGEVKKILSGIADILRLEEERVSATEPELKELLALLESSKSTEEVTAALLNITPQPQEPTLQSTY